MRAFLAAAIFSTCIVAATAKPSPPEELRLTPAPAVRVISWWTVSVMLTEHAVRRYIERVQPGADHNAGVTQSVCRLHTEIFSKLRLAQSCE